MNRAVAARVTPRIVPLERSPDVLAGYLEDAAHYPGGHASALARPGSLEEVAWVVRHAARVLPVGAQSSLTGGATPAGDVLLATEQLNGIHVSGDCVVAGAGVRLRDLQDELAAHGRWFPPVPTFLGATVGGVVATNAAGAATFKYGPVRPWVRALRVVLATGDVLHVERGAVTAQDGRFVVATSEGERHLVVPPLRVPDVPKCSAGYFAAPDMDLVDLFIGSEGTLGVIVEAELLTRARPAGVCWILTSLRSERAAIALTGDLREDAVIDVAAIEHIDARAIDVLREDSVDRRLGITMPAEASVLLLAQIEIDDAAAADGLDERLLDQLARLLDKYGALDTAEIVLPGNARRQAALVELRESVPAGVNRRVAIAHGADARISKTAADMIVPFGAFAPLMEHCRDLARAQDLDVAIWGHISDGNVHPNVIPRSYADVERGRAWILALADRVVSLGGSPLAEHGVGRNPVKQRLLRKLYGSAGVDAMRRLKLDLDPAAKFGAGVLFEMTGVHHAG